jgi:hypothetical protein
MVGGAGFTVSPAPVSNGAARLVPRRSWMRFLLMFRAASGGF